jgi:hypothetical protein
VASLKENRTGQKEILPGQMKKINCKIFVTLEKAADTKQGRSCGDI